MKSVEPSLVRAMETGPTSQFAMVSLSQNGMLTTNRQHWLCFFNGYHCRKLTLLDHWFESLKDAIGSCRSSSTWCDQKPPRDTAWRQHRWWVCQSWVSLIPFRGLPEMFATLLMVMVFLQFCPTWHAFSLSLDTHTHTHTHTAFRKHSMIPCLVWFCFADMCISQFKSIVPFLNQTWLQCGLVLVLEFQWSSSSQLLLLLLWWSNVWEGQYKTKTISGQTPSVFQYQSLLCFDNLWMHLTFCTWGKMNESISHRFFNTEMIFFIFQTSNRFYILFCLRKQNEARTMNARATVEEEVHGSSTPNARGTAQPIGRVVPQMIQNEAYSTAGSSSIYDVPYQLAPWAGFVSNRNQYVGLFLLCTCIQDFGNKFYSRFQTVW